MTTKTIYIHIGLEKTGTTSIQNFLFNNAAALKDKSIFYSTALGENQTPLSIYSGRTQYIESLTSYEKEMKIKNTLPQTIKSIMGKFQKSKCKYLVFSNEHLSSRLKTANDIENLKNLFEPYKLPIKIVIYIRNQVDLLESLYYEAIKTGTIEKLSDWASSFTYFELDLNKLLKEWEIVFGESSIIVKLFEKNTLKNGNAIDDFLNLLSAEDNMEYIRHHNKNISLGYKSIEFMRIYNNYIPRSEQRCYALRNLLSDYNNDKQKISFSNEDRIKIFNTFSSSNQAFLKKYLPEVTYDYFIQTSREPCDQDFSNDVLWEIINHIIQKKTINSDNPHLKNKAQQVDIDSLLNDRWYHFGQMSNKKRIWAIGNTVTKKINLYWLFQPLAKLIKNIRK